jgi:hypothetical protein
MPHQITLDIAGPFFRIDVVGEITLSYLEEILEEMMGRPDHQPNIGILWDFRSGDVSTLTADDFRDMRESRARIAARRGYVRVAILAKDDLTFGISRMAEMSAEVADMPIGVFREDRTAVDWLSRAPGPGAP